eukprot:3611338-Amphidinium_carterae.1
MHGLRGEKGPLAYVPGSLQVAMHGLSGGKGPLAYVPGPLLPDLDYETYWDLLRKGSCLSMLSIKDYQALKKSVWMMESEPIVVDPDPVGILSRPYRLRNWGHGNYAHPSLAEGYIVYPHEVGCYPRSIVPRFVDVGNNNPMALERRKRQERQAVVELRANVPRLVDVGEDDQEAWALRQKQERQALMEMAPISNEDVYPWRTNGDSISTPEDIYLFYWANPIPRPRWELESHREANSFCYPDS